MRVWVIMGNDFPDAVCGNEAAAEDYVKRKKDCEPERQRLAGSLTPIYWRHYEFEVIT